MNIKDFAGQTPEFKPELFLVGRFEGWGMLAGPLGGLKARFTVSAEGVSLNAASVRFQETWLLDQGHKDTLTWSIEALGEGRYCGEEPRLEGPASGDQAGCAFNWRYARDTPQPGGGSVKLHFDDWFWRVGDDALVVRGTASKLGVPFASALVTYHKLG